IRRPYSQTRTPYVLGKARERYQIPEILLGDSNRCPYRFPGGNKFLNIFYYHAKASFYPSNQIIDLTAGAIERNLEMFNTGINYFINDNIRIKAVSNHYNLSAFLICVFYNLKYPFIQKRLSTGKNQFRNSHLNHFINNPLYFPNPDFML